MVWIEVKIQIQKKVFYRQKVKICHTEFCSFQKMTKLRKNWTKFGLNQNLNLT